MLSSFYDISEWEVYCEWNNVLLESLRMISVARVKLIWSLHRKNNWKYKDPKERKERKSIMRKVYVKNGTKKRLQTSGTCIVGQNISFGEYHYPTVSLQQKMKEKGWGMWLLICILFDILSAALHSELINEYFIFILYPNISFLQCKSWWKSKSLLKKWIVMRKSKSERWYIRWFESDFHDCMAAWKVAGEEEYSTTHSDTVCHFILAAWDVILMEGLCCKDKKHTWNWHDGWSSVEGFQNRVTTRCPVWQKIQHFKSWWKRHLRKTGRQIYIHRGFTYWVMKSRMLIPFDTRKHWTGRQIKAG